MAKALCITGMVISVLLTLLFLVDFLMGMIGLTGLAPFRGARLLMDLVFVLCAVGLGLLSFFTFKEQV